MTNLTDEKRKELTLFLGECWHERVFNTGNPVIATCRKCLEISAYHYQRSFTTPNDMVALAKRMVEKGVWDNFIWDEMKGGEDVGDFISRLLTDPARFCWLVSEFLGKEK